MGLKDGVVYCDVCGGSIQAGQAIFGQAGKIYCVHCRSKAPEIADVALRDALTGAAICLVLAAIILLIVCAAWWYRPGDDVWSVGRKFQQDNAYGATANAVQLMREEVRILSGRIALGLLALGAIGLAALALLSRGVWAVERLAKRDQKA